MHPLRANGTGISDGCITFFSVDEFIRFRNILLMYGQSPVLGAGKKLRVYGRVGVTDGEPIYDYDNDGFQCLPLYGYKKPSKSSLMTNENRSPILANGIDIFSPHNNLLLREQLCYQAAKSSILEQNKKTEDERKKER